MFSLDWTDEATDQYDALKKAAEKALAARLKTGKKKKSSKQEGLFKQVHKTLEFLAANPKHPSLNSHRWESLQHEIVPGKKVKMWESYAQNDTPGAYRIFWCFGPGPQQIRIISITPHP